MSSHHGAPEPSPSLRRAGRVLRRRPTARRRPQGARSGLRPDRRLRPDADPRPGRGARRQADEDCLTSCCIGGILGGLAGYGLCYYCSVIAYPMNIGGRPVHSLAGVHSGDVRNDDPRRRDLGGPRHARSQRLADAVSPAVQRRRVQSGVAESVLPLHRIRGQEVRRSGRQRVPPQHRRHPSDERRKLTAPQSLAPSA